MESGEIITTLTRHTGSVMRLQTLESGELVSCSADGTIKIWNLDNAKCIKTLPRRGYTSPVIVIKLGANNTLIRYSNDGTIQIWDLDTCKCIRKIDDHGYSLSRDLLVI